MKLLNNCKIAVCLSGEPRTYNHCSNSIKRYFDSSRGNEFYFFGHSWSGNSYKRFISPTNYIYEFEKEKLETITANLKKHFNFLSLEVEDQHVSDALSSWFYSMMKVNFLKQQYEIENNMMFDLVIHSRFDLVFPEGLKFEDCMPLKVEEKTLYSHFGFYRSEFFLPNPDAVQYAGTSSTMDIIESFYNVWEDGSFEKMQRCGYPENNQWRRVGPGALIHRWAALRNIMIKDCPINIYAVYRKECAERGLRSKYDYNLIKKMEQGIA
jgi:hypothetical protein